MKGFAGSLPSFPNFMPYAKSPGLLGRLGAFLPRRPTPHAFIEREVRLRPINAGQAEAPSTAHGVLNGEMPYPGANLLFETRVPGN